MKLWSGVKLVIVVGALGAANVFATDTLRQPPRSNDAGCEHYVGKGYVIHENARDQKVNYTVKMEKRQLAGKTLLDYYITVEGTQEQRYPILLSDEGDSFQRVLTPVSEDMLNDYGSYVQTGWGQKIEYDHIQREEGTPKKRSILLNFSDRNGNDSSSHILAYRKEGKWQLTSIGVGYYGESNEQVYTWAEKLSQTDDACSSR